MFYTELDHESHDDRVIQATVDKFCRQSKIMHELTIPDSVASDISRFLKAQDLQDGGIRILFVKDFSSITKVPVKFTINDEKDVYMVLERNHKLDDLPNLLLVKIQLTYKGKLRKFWEVRSLPLFEEISAKVDMSRNLHIYAFNNTSSFSSHIRFFKYGEYLGQMPSERNGRFLPNNPIAYFVSKDNAIFVSSPEFRSNFKSWEYIPTV